MPYIERTNILQLTQALQAVATQLTDALNADANVSSFDNRNKSKDDDVQESIFKYVSTGWLPDPVDTRDYTLDEQHLRELKTIRAQSLADKLSANKNLMTIQKLAPSIDLSSFCSPVEDQGGIGSCTAQAVVGLIEYFARRKGDERYNGSRLFLYKTTRRLENFEGDTGAYIRSALRAATSFGVPPEEYWPYTDDDVEFDATPDNFAYALADNYRASNYFRFDVTGMSQTNRTKLLSDLKRSLARGMPFAFGFNVYESLNKSDVSSGHIPLPEDGEAQLGGHAVMGVGYDNKKVITHPVTNKTTTGAFFIRNSWGVSWGEAGYGWLPYEYVLTERARDFWSILDMEWLEAKEFLDS